jgi:hypothetical protein
MCFSSNVPLPIVVHVFVAASKQTIRLVASLAVINRFAARCPFGFTGGCTSPQQESKSLKPFPPFGSEHQRCEATQRLRNGSPRLRALVV